MGDNVFINGRAAVHKNSAGKSIAFPDVCLCPPSPPAGPIPTPLPNTVQAADLDGGAKTVLVEGSPSGKRSSFFAKSTGNEMSRPTGGGVITHGVQGKAYFQTFSMNVMIEGEPAVRHMDLLTHNHVGPQPGNTPPVPWLSTMKLPPGPPPSVRRKTTRGSGIKLSIQTSTGEAAEHPTAHLLEAARKPQILRVPAKGLEIREARGPVEITLPELAGVYWGGARARAGEPIGFGVLSRGLPADTTAEISIRHAHASPSAPPLAQLQLKLINKIARGWWSFEQPRGHSAVARLILVAKAAGFSATSDELIIEPWPLTDVRGVKQLLRTLGYSAGPIDSSEGPELESALEAFQKDHSPLQASGKLDEKTRRFLAFLAEEGL